MNWENLNSTSQLDQIKSDSAHKPVIIFKHSTRCSISRMVLDRLQRNWNDEEMQHVDFYFLDLLSYRDISNKIAQEFKVVHESPQVIIIKDSKPVYDNSHMGIDYQSIKAQVKN
ncbi:MAG TPA: bacillithiol system redox-active protein YtxJ [Cyclobacteriaceae bacterium]|nr:bacillithiol system redox-active protein YtxJ [Cyclobacteriaceae bacterium]